MKIADDLSITLLSKQITLSKFAKNLGVTMDLNLTYDKHITQLTWKCIGSLCQINGAQYLFDKSLNFGLRAPKKHPPNLYLFQMTGIIYDYFNAIKGSFCLS